MSHEHTPDTLHSFSTGGPSSLIIDVLFYLGAFLLLLAVPSMLVSTFLSTADHVSPALVLGVVGDAVGMLCWGFCAVLLYHHPEWPWPWLFVANAGMTRREHAFVVAWISFVGVAAFGALATLLSTQGLSGLSDPAFLIGALIVLVTIGAPVWVISRRMWHRTQ